MNPSQLRKVIMHRVSPDEFVEVLGITIEELIIKFWDELNEEKEKFEDYLSDYEGEYDHE